MQRAEGPAGRSGARQNGTLANIRGNRITSLAHLPLFPRLGGYGQVDEMPSGFLLRVLDHLKRLSNSFMYSRHLKVVGDSMAPTLLDRQHVQTLPMEPFALRNPSNRGKIVAFRHPQRPQSIYIKRIIGLPGEFVAIEEALVTIDGTRLEEPYLESPAFTPTRGASKWFTDTDEFFLLGDNRSDSEDSRTFGPVPSCLIIGEVRFHFWPPGLH